MDATYHTEKCHRIHLQHVDPSLSLVSPIFLLSVKAFAATERFTDRDKLDWVNFRYCPRCPKNNACFKSGQKWFENINLASIVWIRDLLWESLWLSRIRISIIIPQFTKSYIVLAIFSFLKDNSCGSLKFVHIYISLSNEL